MLGCSTCSLLYWVWEYELPHSHIPRPWLSLSHRLPTVSFRAFSVLGPTTFNWTLLLREKRKKERKKEISGLLQIRPQNILFRKQQTHYVRPLALCGGELRTQKLKFHLVRTQSLKVFPLKPGVGQYIAILATLTARDFFLANFYPSGPFTCIFFQNLSRFFFPGLTTVPA